MKKHTTYIDNLYGRCGGKTMIRLLALLLALVVTAPVLLAQDGNQGRDRDHGFGKLDDLTGVWTQTPVGGGHTFLETFHQDGTELVDQQGAVLFDPVQSTMQGYWRKIGFRTFISSCLQLEYNHDKDQTLYGTALVQCLYTLYPSGDQFNCRLVVTETLANGQVNTFGPFQYHGVRFILTPPAF
jgi:hypothetical protein